MDDYRTINRAFWDNRVETHTASSFYDMQAFRAGADSLQWIENEWLGSVAGLDLLHLQCHFGQDTLSLARRGARVTGVDLSPKAIATARELASELSLDAEFICCDVFETLTHLTRRYDVVFTSYGVTGWLPELGPWAQVVAGALKPGGRFLIVEFHPLVWIFDDSFRQITYSYFNRQPIVEQVSGSYADREAPIGGTSYGWNHSLADVIGGLLAEGLEIVRFDEFDTSPYDCLPRSVPVGRGFQIEGYEGKLPLVYALEARRPL